VFFQQCPFENSAIEKIFDRFKNRFSSVFVKELKSIDPRQYVDDEFRDIYQRIGVDVPEEGDDGNVRHRSRGKRRVKDDEEEESAGENEEDEDEQNEAEPAEEEQKR
jgi:condensin complex subunit 3